MSSGERAAPGRTEVLLAAGLAAASGATDVLALSRLGGAFASVVTGNVVVVGGALGQGRPGTVGLVAVAVAAYAVGVLLGALGVRRARSGPAGDARWPVHTTVLCAVEVGVLLLLAVLWGATGGRPEGAVQVGALVAAALAMGLQSAAFRLVPVPGVTTTYFTGTLTTLLLGLVTARRLNVAALVALLALLGGAVLSGLLVGVATPLAALLPPALVAGVVVATLARRRALWTPPGH